MSLSSGLPLIKQKHTAGLVPRCGSCGLLKNCLSPKMKVSGKGQKKILLVGDHPGHEEDRQGRAFVGPSGNLLEKTLRDLGIEMRRDCWLTNALVCRPRKEVEDHQVDDCRPLLQKTVQELRPEVIVLLGGRAVSSLITWLWKESPGKMERWAGWCIPSQQLNAWVVPTYNPAHLLREEGNRNHCVLERMFSSHLEKAIAQKGRPWEKVPDYEKQVRCIYDDEEASRRIDSFRKGDGRVAFDYESNMLRPDSKEAELLCCSLSDGETTFAFPWYGKVLKAMERFVKDPKERKIGWSCKHEDRWSLKAFGSVVRGWLWDGMVTAHLLDNRKGICSAGFQSFVKLGMPDHKSEAKSYMETEEENVPNRLRRMPVEKLLRYCGTDSLIEWKIAHIQMKEISHAAG